ncbi:hypothetical protein ACHAWF_017931 [Thalassiosira exigua]
MTMMPRGKIKLPKAAFLLFLLASSAFCGRAQPPPVGPARPTSGIASSSSRFLTRACSTENMSGRSRGLLERLLTHHCSNKYKQSLTANELYDKNTNSTPRDNTFLIVVLGIICGVISVLGLLYNIDRETFTKVTGVEELPPLPLACNLSKPRIDDDDDDSDGPTPYERDTYLTRETAEYLEEKRDAEVERPMRRLKALFPWCFRAKVYDEGDKYRLPWTDTESADGGGGGGGARTILEFWEELRLRLFWRPAKEYGERDKYAVDPDMERGDDDIKIAASSYESAEKGAAPW